MLCMVAGGLFHPEGYVSLNHKDHHTRALHLYIWNSRQSAVVSQEDLIAATRR